MDANVTNGTEEDHDCTFYALLTGEYRFWLVACFGAVLSLVGILENALLFYALARDRQHRNSPFFYYIVLAPFDMFISLSYVLLHSLYNLMLMLVRVYGFHNQPALWLHRLWWSYFRVVFALSHVSTVVGSYLIVAATFERFLITVRTRSLNNHQRSLVVCSVITLGLVTKGTCLFEFTLEHQPQCQGHTAWIPGSALWADNLYWYSVYFKFYARTIICVFLPFFVLLLLNALIVVVLRRQSSGMKRLIKKHSNANNGVPNLKVENVLHHGNQRQTTREKYRSATRTLLIVVLVYLIANALNVFVTIWEYLDQESLDDQYWQFYSYSADIISILAIGACASRLPIYVSSNAEMRRAVQNAVGFGPPPSYESPSLLYQRSRFIRHETKRCADGTNGVRTCSQYNSIRRTLSNFEHSPEREKLMQPTIIHDTELTAVATSSCFLPYKKPVVEMWYRL